MKLSKLDFVDRSRYKRGVDMDVKHQLLTVALKKGVKADYPLMGREIDRAGYDPVSWFRLEQGRLESSLFQSKKKENKK